MSSVAGPMIDRKHGRFGRAWMFSAVWLIYLGNALVTAWQQPDPALRVVGVTALALFSVAFVVPGVFYRRRRRAGSVVPVKVRWLGLGVMAVLLIIAAPASGEAVIGGAVYVAVTAMITLPFVQAWSLVAVLVVAVEVIPRLVAGWSADAFFGLQLLVAAVAAWGITQVIARGADLARAQQQLAALAAVAERDRVARDMHDILGHSLTVIAVKAELAGRLMSVDPARARQEISDVEHLARQSLADVRETVGGMRRVTLAGELTCARTALRSAGIIAVLPATIDDVPSDRDELYGWVVREGTTNVVRHSGASRCEILLSATGVEVHDNGAGSLPGAPASAGNGLRGLSERVEAAGGTLTAGPCASGGYRLVISSPVGAR